jgi:glucans biosynthesis protein
MNFNYRLYFTRDENQLHQDDVAWVKDTLRSAGDVKQSNLVRQPDGSVAFTLDFTGKAMSMLPEDTQVAPQVSVGDNAEVVEQSVRYNPVTKGWRLVLRLRVKDSKQSTEMRAALVSGDKTLTETWSYQLPANE